MHRLFGANIAPMPKASPTERGCHDDKPQANNNCAMIVTCPEKRRETREAQNEKTRCNDILAPDLSRCSRAPNKLIEPYMKCGFFPELQRSNFFSLLAHCIVSPDRNQD